MEKTDHVIYVSSTIEVMTLAALDKLSDSAEVRTDPDSVTSSWLATAENILTFGLEMMLRCSETGVPFGSLADQLLALSEIGCGAKSAETNLLILSDLLDSPSVFSYPQLLVLAQSVVNACQSPVNDLCLAYLVKPLLQLLALPAGQLGSGLNKHQTNIRSVAGHLLMDIQKRLASGTSRSLDQNVSRFSHLSPTGYKCELLQDLCQTLMRDNKTEEGFQYREKSSVGEPDSSGCLVAWLKNVRACLCQKEACTSSLTGLVSAALVTAKSLPATQAAVSCILRIAQLDPKQAPDFLPLILYVLGQNKNPESRLALMETIPQLATHKFCVPPVLKTIQALGKSKDLKAISLRLMVLLWKIQDRCFPQLLQLISEPINKSSPGTDNILLAKAAAIVEICKHRPEQHGAELLSSLSDILNVANSDSDTPTSALALEGLYLLCQAEVIDLQSLWSVLGEKLIHETRPLVIMRVCRLLSLVPELAVETEEYEKFSQDAVSSLWLYSMSTNPLVSSAAYYALAKFTVEKFRVSYLPIQVTQELHAQAELVANQAEPGDDTVVDVDQLFPQIPGSCYVSLLQQQTNEEKLKSYKSFLSALTRKETANLPKGVFYPSLRRQGVAANQGKALDAIPKFLLQQYDKCKQPGLRPGLAAGLLFCYDPPLEVGRDGRPRKHYIVRHGKAFLQTFTTLLQEIPVQPSDWHRCALMPQGWNSFMERLFLSMLESRKAELDLEGKHGHFAQFENEEKKSFAWLWVRDSILEVIKTASGGPPAAQANSVLALAGLALCMHRFTADMDAEHLQAVDSSSEYMGHAHWLTVTCDTIMSLIDVEIKPKGGLHGLCQQRSTLDRAPASTLCNGMARLAASQLVPVYIARDTERIVQLLSMLAAALPKGVKALEIPTLSFCNGLALGMLLARLFEEHYSEMTGSKGMLAVWKALTALEDISLKPATDNQQGCVLGLGLAICGMCSEGKTESRVHVTTVLDKLQNLWLNTSTDNANYQCLCVAVTSIAGSVYASNTAAEEIVLPIVDKLKQVHDENPQVSGLCLALGLLTYSLSKLGNKAVTQLRQELVPSWLQDVMKEGTPPMEKVSKLNGLLSMIGSEQTLIPVQGSSMMTGSDVNVSEVIALVSKVVVSHSDLGLQNVSAWMLGHLYLSACAVAENRSSVPPNFGYLPESSILRAIVDFLLEAGRMGPESVCCSHVVAALESLKMKAALPPINWAGLLSPLMRVNYGEEVQTLSLEIAASQSGSSSSAAIFLSSWLTPPLFTSLQAPTQAALHRYMPEIIKSISPGVLRLYLERSCLPSFTDHSNTAIQVSVLQGLRDALAVDDPPDAVTMLLHEMTGQMYHVLQDGFNVPVLQSMAECLAQVPDDILDSIIDADFVNESAQIKGSFVRCYLVANGKQPLSLLNIMVDASFNTDYWNQEIGILMLIHCLAAYARHKGEMSQMQIRQQWLAELLGHTHSIVTGAMPLADTAPPMDKVISFVMNEVTCAILTLTHPVYTDLELWGVNMKLFCPQTSQESPDSDRQSSSLLQQTVGGLDLPNLDKMFACLAKYLPAVVDTMAKKPWDVIVPKVIDWLLTLLQLRETTKECKHALLDALMLFRHRPEYRQVTVWTRVAQFPDL